MHLCSLQSFLLTPNPICRIFVDRLVVVGYNDHFMIQNIKDSWLYKCNSYFFIFVILLYEVLQDFSLFLFIIKLRYGAPIAILKLSVSTA